MQSTSQKPAKKQRVGKRRHPLSTVSWPVVAIVAAISWVKTGQDASLQRSARQLESARASLTALAEPVRADLRALAHARALSPAGHVRDAGAVLNARVSWHTAVKRTPRTRSVLASLTPDRRPPTVPKTSALPPAVRAAADTPAWYTTLGHLPAADTLDTAWLGMLRTYDHWAIERAPARKRTALEPRQHAQPDMADVRRLARVHLAKARSPEARAVARGDVEQLARLLASAEDLAVLHGAIDVLEDLAAIEDRFPLGAPDTALPEPATLRRVSWALTGYASAATPDTDLSAQLLAEAPPWMACAALGEGLWPAMASGDALEPALKTGGDALWRVAEALNCRGGTLRALRASDGAAFVAWAKRQSPAAEAMKGYERHLPRGTRMLSLALVAGSLVDPAAGYRAAGVATIAQGVQAGD